MFSNYSIHIFAALQIDITYLTGPPREAFNFTPHYISNPEFWFYFWHGLLPTAALLYNLILLVTQT